MVYILIFNHEKEKIFNKLIVYFCIKLEDIVKKYHPTIQSIDLNKVSQTIQSIDLNKVSLGIFLKRLHVPKRAPLQLISGKNFL